MLDRVGGKVLIYPGCRFAYPGLCAGCPFRALLLIFAHQTVHPNTFSWHLHRFLCCLLKREGDSLEGYTKRSGRNRGRSPRYYCAEQLPVRQYLVSENASGCAYSKVLSYRQFSPMYLTPGTLSRVTDASLSTALQADRRLRQTTQTLRIF